MLAGEKIHLHLLEYESSNDSNYIKDLGEISFDDKGIAKAKFSTNEIQTELNKLNLERGNYEMYFAAEFKDGAIQFADISRKKRGGKDTIYPSQTVHHKQLEKAKFTFIDNKKDITSVRFLKADGKDAYEVNRYGEEIKIKVQTRNLEGTKLKLTILRNRFGNGIEKFPQNAQVTVKNETAEWTVNTATLKNEIEKADWTKIAFWQVEIEEADGDKVKYPKENARLKNGEIDWTKLMTYQSLKLSDNTVISELAKTNAPLVVGVPLEVKLSEKENGICECEAKVRAFLSMLRIGEGTSDEKGYTRIVGGNLKNDSQFSDMSDHPRVYVRKYDSTAAGAYQITKTNWDGNPLVTWRKNDKKWQSYKKKHNLLSFSKVAQDIYGAYLVIIKKKAINEILDDDIEGAIKKCSGEWASLPGSNAGQRQEKLNDLLIAYDNFLKDELNKITTLHVKKGFLKDVFGNGCCKEITGSNVYGSGWNIDIHLWENRKVMGYGILVLKNSEGKEQWRTVVRSQGFSSKIGGDRTKQYSDTPIGIYKFEQWRNDGDKNIYGSNPRLDMTYESGEAKLVGREEIQIHGGRQESDSNPYLWNTGGCLRVFDDAIVSLKTKISTLEKGLNKKEDHYINITHTLKYDNYSEKYFIPDDYNELLKNPNSEQIIKKGIINKKYYRNESNYYTDNIN